VFLNTPQFVCEPLGDRLGARLALKIETLNPIRSFKGRGTDWLVSRAQHGVRLVCASAGNFGQAMAYSCRRRGLDLTVYASTGANELKVERMRALGRGRDPPRRGLRRGEGGGAPRRPRGGRPVRRG
jgi:threonine dehydratase